jgi:hypothetical protein
VTAPDVVRAITAAGGVLTAEDKRIRYTVPVDAKSLLASLEQNKLEVLRLLSPLTEAIQ